MARTTTNRRDGNVPLSSSSLLGIFTNVLHLTRTILMIVLLCGIVGQGVAVKPKTKKESKTTGWKRISGGGSVSMWERNGIRYNDGKGNLAEGQQLLQRGDYVNAARHFWNAILFQAEAPGQYSVDEAFHPFLQCWALQGKTMEGFVFVAKESFLRGMPDLGNMYLQQALDLDGSHPEALKLKRIIEYGEGDLADVMKDANPEEYEVDHDGYDEPDEEYQELYADASLSSSSSSSKTPEEWYEVGSEFFNQKRYTEAASAFQTSCVKSRGRIEVACANAVYCRTSVADWGTEGGSRFEKDMKLIERITEREAASYRTVAYDEDDDYDDDDDDNDDEEGGRKEIITWSRSSSVHPHMMLGYPINSTLKRYASESYAAMDEIMARVVSKPNEGGFSTSMVGGAHVRDLPPDLPYDPREDLATHIFEKVKNPDSKIRVGWVSSGFNSKAVLYLSHDMFRFMDRSKLETHIFSLGAPDSPIFLRDAMRGVDWRQRVADAVDHFHDVRNFKDDHLALARYIHNECRIHILIEWDGYARQGERAQGLFALRPAPVQILHQEFLGTSGASYVDYIFTDRVTSPPEWDALHTEKFLYMPNHFFSKGHAVQKEVWDPTWEYPPAQRPYVVGSGSPTENRCLAPDGVGPASPSIVYCNFNKFLKNNPETFQSWLRVLQQVPDSILCLLENPTEGVLYLRRFVDEVDSELNDRIHFLRWEANPFDHQRRNQDFCHIVLDSHPYNGHTTAQDALYGGVPIVTRSDGQDMSSRVTTSANVVLGLPELNAYGGVSEYEAIAVRLGKDKDFFASVRRRLIDTCLQRHPRMHRYWDVERYVSSFELGLEYAWNNYLEGKQPRHYDIVEDEKWSQLAAATQEHSRESSEAESRAEL